MRKPIDFDAIEAAIRAGEQAQDQLADYYESLTEAELDEEFPEEVTHRQHAAGGLRIQYGVDFMPAEILALRRWAVGDGRSTWRLLHDLVMQAVHDKHPLPVVLPPVCHVCGGWGHICMGPDVDEPCGAQCADAPLCPACHDGDLPCPGCGLPWTQVPPDHLLSIVVAPAQQYGTIVCHNGAYQTEN